MFWTWAGGFVMRELAVGLQLSALTACPKHKRERPASVLAAVVGGNSGLFLSCRAGPGRFAFHFALRL